MIALGRMAHHRGLDRTQRIRTGKLRIKQRGELMTGGELANQSIAPVPFRQGGEKCPGNELGYRRHLSAPQCHGYLLKISSE